MAAAGQNDLFGFTEQESDTDSELEKGCIVEEWGLKVLLINEKKALGMYFSGHIVDEESHWRNHVSFSDLENIQKPNMDGNSVRIIASMITPPIRRKTKTGRILYIINIDDEFERADCLVGEDVFAAVKDNIQVDDVVVVEGKVSHDKQRECNKLSVDKVQPISQYIDENFSKVELNLKSQNVNPTNLKKVLDNLKTNIATTDIQRENVLEIKVSLDDVEGKFEYLSKPFSVYGFVNDISRLIAEGSTVSLSGV